MVLSLPEDVLIKINLILTIILVPECYKKEEIKIDFYQRAFVCRLCIIRGRRAELVQMREYHAGENILTSTVK